MKRNKNTPARKSPSSSNDAKAVTRASIMIVIGLLIVCAFVSNSPHSDCLPEQEIESHIRSIATQEEVTPGFEPAALYYRRPGMPNDKFLCLGTLFRDENHGAWIVTAEHVFRTDVNSPQTISVRTIRGHLSEPTIFINKIVASGTDLGKLDNRPKDVVIASLGTTPVVLKPFSEFIDSELNQHFWGEVKVGDKKITRLRSVLSGEYVDTIGYVRRGKESNGSIFVLIERHSRKGESGTGYVDDFGGLWTLHGGAENQETESAICRECKTLTGKDIHAVSGVSGPLFGKYD